MTPYGAGRYARRRSREDHTWSTCASTHVGSRFSVINMRTETVISAPSLARLYIASPLPASPRGRRAAIERSRSFVLRGEAFVSPRTLPPVPRPAPPATRARALASPPRGWRRCPRARRRTRGVFPRANSPTVRWRRAKRPSRRRPKSPSLESSSGKPFFPKEGAVRRRDHRRRNAPSNAARRVRGRSPRSTIRGSSVCVCFRFPSLRTRV